MVRGRQIANIVKDVVINRLIAFGGPTLYDLGYSHDFDHGNEMMM